MDNKEYFEELYKALDEIQNDKELMLKMAWTPHNSSEPTDYESWEKGCEKFAQDNPDFITNFDKIFNN